MLNSSQQKTLDLMQQGIDSTSEISKLTGINERTIRRHKQKIKRLASTGLLPGFFKSNVPPGFEVTGVSNYQDGQWVKTTRTSEFKLDLIKSYIDGAISVKSPPKIAIPKRTSEDWVNAFIVADLHLGMEAYPEHGGSKWNIEIAENTIMERIGVMLSQCSTADEAWLVNLGDFTHSNDYKQCTPKSGHVLDNDGPYIRTQFAAGRLFKWLVLSLLRKHKRVKIINVPGNHDPDCAWLDVLSLAAFEEDDRVEINQRDGIFHHLKFGSNYIMAAHGDQPKHAQRELGDVMVNHPFWSQSRHRQVWSGHVHHESAKTLRNGVLARSFSTMIPVDAYAHSMGYRTNQTLHRVSLHRDGDQVTHNVQIPLLK